MHPADYNFISILLFTIFSTTNAVHNLHYKDEGVYMYRIAIEKLLKWKQSKRRKPLIIEGARQVGKTWLMKEFGRQAYADTVYINIMEVLEDKTYPFQVNQDNPKIFFIEN